jgi:hypothetical protein
VAGDRLVNIDKLVLAVVLEEPENINTFGFGL